MAAPRMPRGSARLIDRLPKPKASLSLGDDAKWQEFLEKTYKLDEHFVKVGVLESKGGNEPHSEGSDMTLVDVAIVHEYGSSDGRVPERSFIRMTLAALEDELNEVIAKLARAVVTKGMPVEQALNLLGLWVATQIKKAIAGSGDYIPLWPELKPETIRRKGSDRPLVDTGRLMQAIQWEVARRSQEVGA